MNTDSTIGSSGDATPTDLTDRLHANLDYRATRVAVAAPPLSDLLHRSRRRQVRRHAAGVLAGAGALSLAGVAVGARPHPDPEVVTQTASEHSPGTGPQHRLDLTSTDPCRDGDAWYLGLRYAATSDMIQRPSLALAGSNDLRIVTPASGKRRVQAFLTAPDAVDGPSLLLSRTTLADNVEKLGPAANAPGTLPLTAVTPSSDGVVGRYTYTTSVGPVAGLDEAMNVS